MTTGHLLTVIASALCACIVLSRCIGVVNNMHIRTRDAPYWKFVFFGFSYALLAVAALSAMFQAWDGRADMAHWLFIVSSAGMIITDRRRKE